MLDLWFLQLWRDAIPGTLNTDALARKIENSQQPATLPRLEPPCHTVLPSIPGIYCRIMQFTVTVNVFHEVWQKKQLLVGIMPWHFVAMNPQQPSPRQIVFVPDNNRPHVFTNSKTESLCVDDVTLEFHRQKAWLDCWLTLLQWYLNQSIPCCLQGLEKSATKHRSHVSLATCLHMIIYDNATIQTTRKTMQNLPTQDSWHQNTFATQNFLKASGAIEITISKFGCRSSDALISKTNSQ